MRKSVENRNSYAVFSADNTVPTYENARANSAMVNNFADTDMVSAFVFSALRLTVSIARIIMIIRIIKCKNEYSPVKG